MLELVVVMVELVMVVISAWFTSKRQGFPGDRGDQLG
jgi:flagellar basal body-associated protein FliL